jgi:NADH dehydrogenase/NADH:ubiquinone oxidoreductase subunit G
MAKVTIDGIVVEVENGNYRSESRRKSRVKIPRLSYHPDQDVKGNCRICVVEIEGQRLLQPACAYPVSDGMVVHTNTARARKARYNILERSSPTSGRLPALHPQPQLRAAADR